LAKICLFLFSGFLFFISFGFYSGIASEWGTSRSWINVSVFLSNLRNSLKFFFSSIYPLFWKAGKNNLADWRQGFRPFLIVLGVIGLMMLLQPDLEH
jgi:hypothetical protein